MPIAVYRLTVFVLLGLLSACSKTSSPVKKKPEPVISSYSPSSLYTGAKVTLTGFNFGTVRSDVMIFFDGISIEPDSVAPTVIRFTIPPRFITSDSARFEMWVSVKELLSEVVNVTVKYVAEVKRGWYYVAKNITNAPGPGSELYFYGDPPKLGLAYRRNSLMATSDDGAIWGGIWEQNAWGSAFHVYDEDEAWIEVKNDIMVYDYEYVDPKGYYARIDTIFSIPALTGKAVTGAFITKRSHGYLLTHDGSVLKINGSFAPSNIQVEYQCSNYESTPFTYDVNSYRDLSGIDSNNMMFYGKPAIGGIRKHVIVLKRNGEYEEHQFDINEFYEIIKIKAVEPNQFYFTTINYEMYRYDASLYRFKKLVTPNIRNFCFVTPLIGYACTGSLYNERQHYIYKTIDGGNTWTREFTLDPDLFPANMTTKNGKVWVTGSDAMGTGFVLKYNP